MGDCLGRRRARRVRSVVHVQLSSPWRQSVAGQAALSCPRTTGSVTPKVQDGCRLRLSPGQLDANAKGSMPLSSGREHGGLIGRERNRGNTCRHPRCCSSDEVDMMLAPVGHIVSEPRIANSRHESQRTRWVAQIEGIIRHHPHREERQFLIRTLRTRGDR